MKRILALFLSAALLLALLCACTAAGPDPTVVPPSDSAGESASVPPTDTTQEPSLALPGPEQSEEVSEAPSAEPSQEPSQAPATQPPATQAPATQPPATQAPATQPPATQAPATQPPASPDPSPTIPGGGIIIPGFGDNTPEPTDQPGEDPNGFTEPKGPSASDVNLANFYQAITSNGNYAFPAMDVPPSTEWLSNYIPGLASIPVVQRLVFFPKATSNGVEIVLVQVTNSSDVGTVKSVLQAHIDYKASDFNYPQVTEAWQNNARVVSKGDYIMMIVHSEYESIIADFNALF